MHHHAMIYKLPTRFVIPESDDAHTADIQGAAGMKNTTIHIDARKRDETVT